MGGGGLPAESPSAPWLPLLPCDSNANRAERLQARLNAQEWISVFEEGGQVCVTVPFKAPGKRPTDDFGRPVGPAVSEQYTPQPDSVSGGGGGGGGGGGVRLYGLRMAVDDDGKSLGSRIPCGSFPSGTFKFHAEGTVPSPFPLPSLPPPLSPSICLP